MSTPAMPPNVNVEINPNIHSMGEANVIFPPYIVIIKLNTITPVGIAIIMVMIPKNAFTLAPAPMVKK